ncbi:MAG TPA: tRNA (adenosine(37)-N6)-threonylcarbamoyltransferase complex ATPase subunit type 1 TsaE [Anaerohalosphaeraceae bacterium]|nr:tRNA (adenosine(37)-N6)-threonylcarbamoyltransferase complex ATPase subunit type 1 TsaE [Anaerohalosphaeraceae bacterium]HOL89008.1 tRNA (adenosine(37)-N6)-threonylcarbamoyltransferase complex ATPase subunit type 1 TsaE [Anaerohalosphaeraceae bacterium]HPP56459.1 tRNA (adenosine(37)-N6)-threonylcarbamoyltransferase complex ATPase subunit type 1 TsaE [Anaerohalosphaeraceae bacterium]
MTEANVFETITHSPEETMELGRRFGAALKGGEVAALIGTLGTGKTHFIKGVAAGLGAAGLGAVNSPTFVLMNEYCARDGRLTVYHIDAYRLKSIEEFENLGVSDYLGPDAVLLIEWADKVLAALEGLDYIRIDFSHEGPTERKIIIKGPASFLACLQAESKSAGFPPSSFAKASEDKPRE